MSLNAQSEAAIEQQESGYYLIMCVVLLTILLMGLASFSYFALNEIANQSEKNNALSSDQLKEVQSLLEVQLEAKDLLAVQVNLIDSFNLAFSRAAPLRSARKGGHDRRRPNHAPAV